ncbi:MAG: hypothetical protein EA377_10895 [Phycisphaerales bacterium]|nr:MAG: hypothetical protein EA377_10895 [Phycisphaerales bacterium]
MLTMRFRASLLSVWSAAAVVVAALAAPSQYASAQEAINSPAATQPSRGTWVLRNQFRYLEARADPRSDAREFRQVTIWNSLAYGISSDLSASFELPVVHRSFRDGKGGPRKRDTGIADMNATLKWRIYQDDFGPIDTSRVSLLGGLQIRSGDSEFTSDSYDPFVGAVWTYVHGRHGVNASGRYKFNTGGGTEFNLGGGDGSADALLYDASYLYRLDPETYTAESKGAWYAVVEFNGVYETNGDNELMIAPGIMYEARAWTVEASFQLPIWQELDHRPESRFGMVVGLRLQF